MISYLANPSRYLKFSKNFSPFAGWITLVTLLLALYYSLLKSPPAEEHGQAVRMMYTHVPAAWCALLAYTCLTVASMFSFIWRHPLADSAAKSIATPGLAFTFLALLTGSLWGKPAWGTWWQWDARITSTLILFIMYLGLFSLHSSFTNFEKADKFISVLVLIGFVNIPIIKKSVDWWSTLHQPASITLTNKPTIDPSMLYPVFFSMIGFSGLIVCLVILSSKVQIFNRESNKSWVKDND